LLSCSQITQPPVVRKPIPPPKGVVFPSQVTPPAPMRKPMPLPAAAAMAFPSGMHPSWYPQVFRLDRLPF
jgi:hypothetical protein